MIYCSLSYPCTPDKHEYENDLLLNGLIMSVYVCVFMLHFYFLRYKWVAALEPLGALKVEKKSLNGGKVDPLFSI